MKHKFKVLTENLRDERSKQVVFVAHCLLNENTRYLGGAFRKGCVDEVLDEIRGRGIGIVQMKCPEQKAWGGVLKRYLWLGLGTRETILFKLKGIILPVFIWYTERVCKKIAKEIASEIGDYIDSGFEVVGVIGVDGSPACGVDMTVDIEKSFDCLASFNIDNLDRNAMNERVVRACLTEGTGLFVKALKDRLVKQNLAVGFSAHDLVSEMTDSADNKDEVALEQVLPVDGSILKFDLPTGS